MRNNIKFYHKINNIEIELELDALSKLKTVKLIFNKENKYKFVEIQENKIDKYKFLIEKDLKYFQDANLITKKIKLFLNETNPEYSTFIASIIINDNKFYLGYYSYSEGVDLKNYLENYKTPSNTYIMFLRIINYLKIIW